ncbi:MAG: hypothetical protein FWD47_14605 [Treponema sp.]|nr:hypothetical protein [Treponema sp.]
MCDKKSTIFVVCPIGDDGTDIRENSDDVFEVIERIVKNNKILNGYGLIRADKIEKTGRITTQIYKQLKTADVCIVDLTALKPNVFYELGIRQALLKPYVLIAKKGTALPFDIQNDRVFFYDSSSKNWGYTLEDTLINPLLAAIGGHIDEFDETYFRRQDDSEILRIYEKRINMDVYNGMMEKASKNVDVLGYSLKNFPDNMRKFFEKYQDEKIKIKIRILVVDPDSIYSQERETLEGDLKGEHKKRVEELREFLSKYDFVELKKISTPPSSMIFRIDDDMFVGPYLYKPSAETETFQLKKSGKLFKLYESEFKAMWEKAEEFVCETVSSL